MALLKENKITSDSFSYVKISFVHKCTKDKSGFLLCNFVFCIVNDAAAIHAVHYFFGRKLDNNTRKAETDIFNSQIHNWLKFCFYGPISPCFSFKNIEREGKDLRVCLPAFLCMVLNWELQLCLGWCSGSLQHIMGKREVIFLLHYNAFPVLIICVDQIADFGLVQQNLSQLEFIA